MSDYLNYIKMMTSQHNLHINADDDYIVVNTYHDDDGQSYVWRDGQSYCGVTAYFNPSTESFEGFRTAGGRNKDGKSRSKYGVVCIQDGDYEGVGNGES
jgi:hypothetical protein